MNAKNLTGLLCSMLTAFILMSCDGVGNDDTDTDAPDAPVITSPVNGATINISTVTIRGTAEAGSSVELFDMNDTAPIGTAKADFNGDWSLTISPLADGVHNLTATATDAACNTSSPSTALIITVDTTLPGYADIPKLDCNTLLTIDDIDEALAYERDTVDFEKGEVCRTYIYSDERVYVQIEPGWPADFFPATELLDSWGEPVSGVGDEARWFFGIGSAGGPVGLLCVRQDMWFGVLYFRIAVGRPDLNTAELLDLVKGLALNALPRFPGVGEEEPPREIPPPEPVDTSSHGYAENLLEKEADGEWTRGEGLVATLRLFAGEVDPDEVLRYPDLLDFGSDIIRMATEYLEGCDVDPAAQSEIERLLAMFMQQPTRSETEGASLPPFELDTDQRLMTQQETESPLLPAGCQMYYDHEDNCWSTVDIKPEIYGVGTYRFMGPTFTRDTGWTDSHKKLFISAMTQTIAKLYKLDIAPPQMDLMMTPYPKLSTKIWGGADVVTIGVGTNIQAIAAKNEDQAKQVLAALIASSTLDTTHFPDGSFAKGGAWHEAGAMFLSDVVYPLAQLEHKFDWTVLLSWVETRLSMLRYDKPNWSFLEDMGETTALELLRSPSAKLETFPGIKELIHEYAKNLTSGVIADQGKPHKYTIPPQLKVSLNSTGKKYGEVVPFRALRVEFSVDGGEYACVKFPSKDDLQVSWKPGSVGNNYSWFEGVPDVLGENNIFIVTSTVAGKFVIDVKKFVEDPEDCPPEEEDDGNGTGDCDCGVCGCTEFIKPK